MILYHITLRRISRLVMNTGIDPAYSRGKLRASWYCTRAMIPVILYHVSHRDGNSPTAYMALRVNLTSASVRRSRWPGVYYSPDVCEPKQIQSALIAAAMLVAQKGGGK